MRQAGGKLVHAWAVEGDCDAGAIRSNTFELHGRSYPEVDRAGWFALDAARAKLNPAQAAFIDRLEELLAGR